MPLHTFRKREQHLTPEQQALKWVPGPRVDGCRTHNCANLPNGCSATIFQKYSYGERGGQYSLFGYQVFAVDGTLIADHKTPCWDRRWVMIKNAYIVAERSGGSVAA